jgi:hypothetical protein
MLKDDTLINAASVTPEADAGCWSTCYYVGYDYEHDHGGCLTNGLSATTPQELPQAPTPC